MRRKSVIMLVSLLTAGAVFAGGGREGRDAQTRAAKDTLVYGVTLAAEGNFHPTLQYSNADREVIFLVYSRLVSTDPNGGYVPELAESFSVSGDARTYTFNLRKDVKWTDGQPFTAHDVAFTYATTAHPKFARGYDDFAGRLLGGEEYHQGKVDHVEGVKVIDDYTVSFTFIGPYRDAMVKFIDKSVFAKHIWEKVPVESWLDQRDLLRNPVGTGPYKLAEYVQDQYVRLTANEDYFKGAPKIKNFVLKLSNADTRQAELLGGELDIAAIGSWKPRDLEEYTKNNIPITEVKGIVVEYLVFNTNDPVFKDARIRLAAAHALDRKALIEAVENGHAVAAETIIQPSQRVYPKNIGPYEYDPQKSYTLLKEAGYSDTNGDGIVEKNGQPLRASLIYYGESGTHNVRAQAVQSYLRKAGFDVELRRQDFNAVLSTLRSTSDPFQLAFMGATYRPNPGYGGNHLSLARFKDPKNDELLKKANGSVNEADAVVNFAAWGQYIHDTAPLVALYFKNEGEAYNPKLSGYAPTATEWFPDVEKWYFIP